jgi:hypothetical protein
MSRNTSAVSGCGWTRLPRCWTRCRGHVRVSLYVVSRLLHKANDEWHDQDYKTALLSWARVRLSWPPKHNASDGRTWHVSRGRRSVHGCVTCLIGRHARANGRKTNRHLPPQRVPYRRYEPPQNPIFRCSHWVICSGSE